MPFFNISSTNTNSNPSVGGFTGYYATLVDVTNDSYIFEIKFYVKWKDILKNELQTYSIRAYNFDVQRDESTNELVDSKSASSKSTMISNAGGDTINSWLLSAKNKANQILNYQNAKIYDSEVQPLFSGPVEYKLYQSSLNLYKYAGGKIDYAQTGNDYSLLSLSSKSNIPSTISNSNFGNTTSNSIRENYLSLITYHLTDPADAFKISEFFDENSGENSGANSQQVSLCKSIHDFHTRGALLNLPKEPLYFGSEYSKNVKLKNHFVSKQIVIPKEKVKSQFDFFVTLYYSSNSSKDSTGKFKKYYGSYHLPKRRVEISKHLRFYNAITQKYPTATSNYTDKFGNKSISSELKTSFGSLDIITKQITNKGFCYNFSDPFTVSLGFSKVYTAPTYPGSENFLIYRTFAKNSNSNIDVTSQQFSSTVVGNPIQALDTTVVLFGQNDGFLDVEVKNIPKNLAVLFLRLEKQMSGGEFQQVYYDRIALKSQRFHKQKYPNLENKKIYRLTVSYSTTDGSPPKKSTTAYYKYFDPHLDTSVSTGFNNLQVKVENGSPVVSFEVTSAMSEQETDRIATILSQTSIGLEYANEVNALKDKFGSIVSHKVYRTNLNTGIRETFKDLGNITAGALSQLFLDNNTTRQLANVLPYDLNALYLYEISVLKHDPKVMLRDFVVDGTSDFGKVYQYKPYRWLQKRTLEEGTYFAEDSQGNLINHSQMDADEIGVKATVLVPPKTQNLQIGSPTLERVDSKKVKLTWKLQVNIRAYDHFVVTKEVNGIKKVLGCFMNNEIIDELRVDKPPDDTSGHDFGTLLYYVTPVLNDFSVLPSARSNAIIVDPFEFQYNNYSEFYKV